MFKYNYRLSYKVLEKQNKKEDWKNVSEFLFFLNLDKKFATEKKE